MTNKSIDSNPPEETPSSTKTTMIFFTPEKVAELKRNQCRNRKLSSQLVQKYVRLIKEGSWISDGGSIKINVNGETCDGQHRLEAIERTGANLWYQIETGVSLEAMQYIDTGKSRTAIDVNTIRGLNVSNTHLACANAMGLPNVIYLRDQNYIGDIFLRHEEAIRFVCDRKKTKGSIHIPCVLAATLAKAWYYENHKMLERFLEVFTTGFCEDKSEWAAIGLQRSIKSPEMQNLAAKYRLSIFNKSQNAIKAFRLKSQEKFFKSSITKQDNYPLPEFCEDKDIRRLAKCFDQQIKAA